MNQYNDYELLYLIYECDEEALGILFKKYDPLIRKKLRDFRIDKYSYDDFYQECLIALMVAIRTYNPFYSKSFMRYLELIVTRKIMNVMYHNKKSFYDEIKIDDDFFMDPNSEFIYDGNYIGNIKEGNLFLKDQHISLGQLSNLEKEVLELKYVKGLSSKEIAKTMNVDLRKVYNSVYQAKKKVRGKLESKKTDI